ncbi:ATP-binding protein [Clostridium sp. KNHs216]|uniref:ATP-binding protein n=1 Tax=Clostridium sp. KNHs216 TaxID=1550235 RepID=UPI001152AA19|nr:ATP-binding protein [Clostridium sp. KNHs216]TQI66292.1 hypothetical protein LY85_0954 [Clostridium sp. KNHs216]
MNLVTQSSMILLPKTVSEATDAPSFSSTVDSASKLSDTIQNLWWLAVVIFTALILIVALFSIRRKTIKYTRTQINRLIKNRKYIPGIFVELNESKEVLRYFVYSRKWKERLIKSFNFLYDNAYGDILRKACNDPSACFHLRKTATLEEIEKAVTSALDLHNRFRHAKEELRPDYSQSQYLFEINYSTYMETLEALQQYIEAANGRYLILTGSAGNGKTNLLCSISELLIKLKEAVVLLNSRDIEGDVLGFLFNELKLPEIYKKHTGLYLSLVNLLLTIQRKHLFIIIDAINENDNDGFGNRIVAFCNEAFKYSRVKVIVSCRNEYYQERFQEYLVEKVDTSAFEFDLKEQRYTSAAIDRIIKAYSKYFNYDGTISPAVQNVLSEQLLLLRIFFEVNKDGNIDVLSVRKHEIFAQYIETAKKNGGENIENLLDTLADAMLANNNFDEISLLELEKAGISPKMIKETVDSSILISKKLVFHEGTIARNETEVVYFVFDEMRDYYLARRILLKNIAAGSMDGNAILTKLKELKEAGVSCTEGIIHYTYVFFRTDATVVGSSETEKLCNAILDIYRIHDGRETQSYWKTHHREEFQNLGLRIILTSGLPMTDFEVSYIQDCLRKDPYEDGGVFFDTMLDGTIYEGIYDLDTYLDILLGMKDKDAILNAFSKITARNGIENRFLPADLVKDHKKLADIAPASALQIQKVAELFLCCFKLNDTDVQDQLIGYFYTLPAHDKVQQEMISRIRKACGLEVNDYE